MTYQYLSSYLVHISQHLKRTCGILGVDFGEKYSKYPVTPSSLVDTSQSNFHIFHCIYTSTILGVVVLCLNITSVRETGTNQYGIRLVTDLRHDVIIYRVTKRCSSTAVLFIYTYENNTILIAHFCRTIFCISCDTFRVTR